MSAGSYVTSSFSQSLTDEVKRLGIQVDLFWEFEKDIYTEMSLPSNAKILEVGSGPGFYTKKLSGVFTDANFVSLEYDKDFAAFQSEVVAKDLGDRIEVINGDVLTFDRTEQFDMVVARMVLEHLPNPEAAFDKISSLVKTGGRLVLLDNDFTNHLRTYPRVDELSDLYAAYCKMRVDQGGNPYIGRELPSYFDIAGYDDVSFSTVSAHTFSADRSLFLGAESSAIGMTLVGEGYLDQAVFNKLIVGWSKMARDPSNVMMRELYCAQGIKGSGVVSVAENRSANSETVSVKGTENLANVQFDNAVLAETELEKQISDAWCKVLSTDTVPVNVSFFEVGGESYLLPLVVESLKSEHQIDVEITDLFEHPSVSELAEFVGSKDSGASLRDSLEAKQTSMSEKRSSGNPFDRLKKKN